MDKTHSHVPPGFRFHPTDEELINFYLKKKVAQEEFELDHVICEVDLNKLEPWDLHEKCKIDASHQTEWYFFSHKDKKYPTGTRTNRATAAGFWKATGRDKAVHSTYERIGMRKTLVFYRGRAPHGKKTNWIMHEYRLEDKDDESKNNEDGWVVCRVFKKRNLIDSDNHDSNANLSDEDLPSSVANKAKKQRIEERSSMVRPPLTCKQEDQEENPPRKLAFLQLPHLASPTVTPDTPTTYDNPANFKRMLNKEGYEKGTSEQPSSSCSEDGLAHDTMEECSKAFLMSEENLAEFIYNGGPFSDGWSVYDSIARYHLDMFSLPGDVPQSLQLTRSQQSLEYPSNCAVDLWNFTR